MLKRSVLYYRYGFLEGIWYLDILHHGHVPKTNSASLYKSQEAEEVYDDDEENFSCDEDELERAELRRLQRQIDDQNPLESQEERDYKLEFFELLDEVLFLLGKSDDEVKSKDEGDDTDDERKSLRDTHYFLHQGKLSSSNTPPPSHDKSGQNSRKNSG